MVFWMMVEKFGNLKKLIWLGILNCNFVLSTHWLTKVPLFYELKMTLQLGRIGPSSKWKIWVFSILKAFLSSFIIQQQSITCRPAFFIRRLLLTILLLYKEESIPDVSEHNSSAMTLYHIKDGAIFSYDKKILHIFI